MHSCLRIYAITFRNKFVAAYFAILASMRFALSFASGFLQPPTLNHLPPIQLGISNFCPDVLHLKFKVVPYVFATVFGEQLCLFRPLVYIPRIADRGST